MYSMKKFVIANGGIGAQRKSSSVKAVLDLLSEKYLNSVLINNGDIKATVQIRDKKSGRSEFKARRVVEGFLGYGM